MTGSKNGRANIKTLILAVAAGLLLVPGALAHEEKRSAPPQAQNLKMPNMDPAVGRKLFVAKGCVACHSINGVGGRDAKALDADTMKSITYPFELAAKMWAAAPYMIAAQEEALGAQILFSGEELGHIIAFVHSAAEQYSFSNDDIPPEVMPMMQHSHGAPGGDATKHPEELGQTHSQENQEG